MRYLHSLSFCRYNIEQEQKLATETTVLVESYTVSSGSGELVSSPTQCGHYPPPSHTAPFAYPPLAQGATKRGYMVVVSTMLAH